MRSETAKHVFLEMAILPRVAEASVEIALMLAKFS